MILETTAIATASVRKPLTCWILWYSRFPADCRPISMVTSEAKSAIGCSHRSCWQSSALTYTWRCSSSGRRARADSWKRYYSHQSQDRRVSTHFSYSPSTGSTLLYYSAGMTWRPRYRSPSLQPRRCHTRWLFFALAHPDEACSEALDCTPNLRTFWWQDRTRALLRGWHLY